MRGILLLTGYIKGIEEELIICKKTCREFEKYYKNEPVDIEIYFTSKFKDGKSVLSTYSSQLHALDKLQLEIDAEPA